MGYFVKKLIVVVLVIVVIVSLVSLGYNYTKQTIKTNLSKFLETNLKASLTVGCIKFWLPLCIEIKRMKINNSIDIYSTQIYPDPIRFLLKEHLLILRLKIVSPVVRIKKGGNERSIIPDFIETLNGGGYSKNNLTHSLYFSTIQIQNGSMIYHNDKEKLFEVVKIKGGIKNQRLDLLHDSGFLFAGAGFIKNNAPLFLSPLKMSGYIGNDKVIRARCYATDINFNTLSLILPGYFPHLIKKGRLDLESNIQVSKHKLIAKCYLKGKDITLSINETQKLDKPIVASLILSVNFNNNIVKVESLKTNLLDFLFAQSKGINNE